MKTGGGIEGNQSILRTVQCIVDLCPGAGCQPQPSLALSLSKFKFLSPDTDIKIKDMVEITDRLAPGPGFSSNLRPVIDVFELEDPQLLKAGWNGSAPQRVHGRHAVKSAAVYEANFISSPEHPHINIAIGPIKAGGADAGGYFLKSKELSISQRGLDGSMGLEPVCLDS